jgi:hypothetical protein
MKKKNQRKIAVVLFIAAFAVFGVVQFSEARRFVSAQESVSTPTPAATPAEFNQADALARLREQIKGKEKEPAEKVFKNIQTLKGVPAGRFLAIMEMGFARSLGVTCAHCHAAEKWESEDKNTKQIAREMWALVGRINGELLKTVKNLKSETPTVNCTTCHRGQTKPALNLPAN